MMGGETRRALVSRWRLFGVSMDTGVSIGVTKPTLTLVALPISAMMESAEVPTLVGRSFHG